MTTGTEERPAWRRALRPLELLVYWAPVWAPLVFFGQLAILGMKPALAERRRLAACEAELDARLAESLERREELGARLEALDDPIFQERLRRVALED